MPPDSAGKALTPAPGRAYYVRQSGPLALGATTMRILVTGGAGFIGSHIVDRLLEAGHRVTVVDDLSTGQREQVSPAADFHAISVFDPACAALCRGAEAVIHAAAQTSVADSTNNPERDALLNVLGTIRMLDLARKARVQRFVYLSSAAVYGPRASPPITEEQPPAPASPYGLSKWVGEEYVRLLAGEAGMAWVILRLANVYGPRQQAAGEAGVIARWAAGLTAGQPILLQGDGSQTRDFIYVGDVAAAAVAAVEQPALSGCTLNIGTGRESAIGEVLRSLESLTGRRADLVQGAPRQRDIPRSVLKTDRARQLLAWEAATPLHDGLAKTVAWVKHPG